MLVVGGGSKAADIFDPATKSFALTGITEMDRFGHSATLLQNGKVVFIGGIDSQGDLPASVTAEVY